MARYRKINGEWEKTAGSVNQEEIDSLKQDLNNVKQELNNNSFTPIPTNASCNNTHGGYIRIGKLIIINARFRANQRIDSYTNIGTMPASSFGDNISAFNINRAGLMAGVYNGNLFISTNGGSIAPINSGDEFIINGIYVCS